MTGLLEREHIVSFSSPQAEVGSALVLQRGAESGEDKWVERQDVTFMAKICQSFFGMEAFHF